jgi:hypothetical protein
MTLQRLIGVNQFVKENIVRWRPNPEPSALVAEKLKLQSTVQTVRHYSKGFFIPFRVRR